ncbi:DUF4212 domain-containing protein [Roseateles koreensis]|uniref:DUF4212 domain-containing protein n=1 Tax=Roseateles koreensis TaxID=2987526 RepID=A0ABT5KM91_9BURK|nr:sodium/substrate symporter small subunit [Roseateles koreensis]MDC8783595.1 DUF4212 domain-containing protein [Roseateles koreensis]
MDLRNFETPDQPAPRRAATPAAHVRYWRRTCQLTLALLVLWALVSFGLIYFARELSFEFFGWPFGFWVASQGALLVFCCIVAGYAWTMNRLDDAALGAGRDII